MSTITYLRLFTDTSGKSQMERGLKIEMSPVDFAPPAPPFSVSGLAPASSFAFLQLPPGWTGDWHPSPKRQWVFYLRGEMEYETGDGNIERVGPGSFMLTEDTTGQGHRSRVIGKTAALLVAMQL